MSCKVFTFAFLNVHGIMKCFLVVLGLFLLLGGALFYSYRWVWNAPALSNSHDYILWVDEGHGLEQVQQMLEDSLGLQHTFLFKKVVDRMNVAAHIKPGRYTLKPGLSLIDLARVLRSAADQTVNIVIRGSSDVRSIPAYLSEVLMPSKEQFVRYHESDSFIASLGFNRATFPAMFIPNTYNVFYFSDPTQVYLRLNKEYERFWNEDRKAKANLLGLSPVEVSTLASIVDKETTQIDEMPRIAGVYLNRLKANHPLQADPTVKFALDSASLNRILIVHTQIEHPYNTYYIVGLPPGPICIPSVQAIEAVLNAENHKYFYFCAQPNFSGYHHFAVTYSEHLKNRKAYQRFLNQIQ